MTNRYFCSFTTSLLGSKVVVLFNVTQYKKHYLKPLNIIYIRTQ